MVMRVDCIAQAIESAESRCWFQSKGRRILLTPQGHPLTQGRAREWVRGGRLVLVCGRYEGFDERIRDFVDEEISLGDFILMGGEIPAMAILEVCARLLGGVLGNEASSCDESFSAARGGMLEYPQYTRPLEYRGRVVPEVLRSGDHAKIRGWREQQSCTRTRQRRPDLVKTDLSDGQA